MIARLWRIATDAPGYEADDLSGLGAEKTGGRWNSKGRAVVYTSPTISLACLETIVHLSAKALPLNRFLVRIEIPDDVWDERTFPDGLDLGWQSIPEGRVSLKVGDDWLASRASALLEAPSVIVPEESNILINPEHPGAAKIVAFKVRQWLHDGRLKRWGAMQGCRDCVHGTARYPT